MSKYKTLVVGLGNIGAGYDFNNSHVLTHVKAFSKHVDFDLTVVDQDMALTRKVAEKYDVKFLESTENISFSGYDCVSICTPTTTHVKFLNQAFRDNVSLVICEKPVASKTEDLNTLLKAYAASDTKVLVNYMRSFLPSMHRLKKVFNDILLEEKLTNINVYYLRGFINNASHAWNLIEFLTGQSMDLTECKITGLEYDTFSHDPTLSLQGKWEGVSVNMNGLKNLDFGCFEIDLFFNKHRIRLTNSGDKVEVLRVSENNNMYNPLSNLETWGIEGCVGDYMIPVIEMAANFLKGDLTGDNFEKSISLNKKMLNILSN